MRRSFLATIGVAAVLALVVPGASANMVLTLDDTALGLPGVNEVIMADGLAAGVLTASGLFTTHADTNIGVFDGKMTYNGGVGAGVFTLTVATGISKPFIGPPAQIHLNTVTVSSAGAGNLIIGLTDTGFAGLLTPAPWPLRNDIAGLTGGIVSSTWTADDVTPNWEFGIGSMGAPTIGPFVGGFTGFGYAPPGVAAAPFSLSNWVSVTHAGVAITSFDSHVMIPAPGAVVLGVIGLGLVGRMKRWLS